jgi:hypothetical protein
MKMKKLTIAINLFDEMQAGNSWLVVQGDTVKYTAKSRSGARTLSLITLPGQEALRVVKSADVHLDVVACPDPVKVTKAPKTPRVKAPAIPMFHESTIDSPCSVVWGEAEATPDARRVEVIARCVAKGVAFYTARTQYQLWRQARKEQEANAAEAAKKK